MERLNINNPWPAPVFYKPGTDSTMLDARRLVEQGCPPGTVVMAGYQQAGRGRFPQRGWESSAGKNLLFTLLLGPAPTVPRQRLPVLMGLALALALEEGMGLKTLVKWPNDLLYGEQKLAGILCEAHARAVLVGIGLNSNQEQFPPTLRRQACSLRQILGRRVHNPRLLERILGHIKRSLEDTDWRAKLRSRLYGLGESMTVNPGPELAGSGKRVVGILKDLAEDGRLVIQPEGSSELLRISSGELKRN